MAIESVVGLIVFTIIAVAFSIYASKHRAEDHPRDDNTHHHA